MPTSNPQLNLGNRSAPRRSGGVIPTVFMVLFAVPFAGFGLLAIVNGIRKAVAGDGGALVECGFGVAFSCAGLGIVWVALWARKQAKKTAELQARHVDQPWKWRADWVAGKIKSSAMAQPFLVLIVGLAFAGMGGLLTFGLLPGELQKRNHAALLILIFPIIGICLLAAFVRAGLARKRYGQCFFELAQVPVPLGGALSGMIQTGTRLQPTHGLHLKLSCLRRVVTGSGENRSTSETVLWQDEKVLQPGANLPEFAPGHTNIPVYFKLPAGQPECSANGGVSVRWRLEARAKMAGPDFAAVFDLPVFQVAGSASEVPDDADPTAALQMPMDELRREEHSRIQVSDGPGGREFFFPAARNPGAALFTTVIATVFDGAVGLILRFHGPVVMAVFLGLFGVLLSCFALSLWFKSTRVTINATGVKTVNRWLIFSRAREFNASDIARFASSAGMVSGAKTYLDLKLVTKSMDGGSAANPPGALPGGRPASLRFGLPNVRGVTVASSIASTAEANWLAREMNRALGRRE